MKVKEYAEFVDTRASSFVDLNYCVIALNGEAGEIAEWYKKGVLRKDPKFDDYQLMLECGDVLFYLQKICTIKGWTLKQLMDENKKKLIDRYGTLERK